MDNVEKRQIGEGGQYLYIVPAMEDNYIYLLSWEKNALVVDPGDGKKVLALLEEEGLTLTNILITHHHADHTGGNDYLKKKTECAVIGPEDDRVPCLEQSVAGGEELLFGPFIIEVIATPGHTKPHVVYFFRDLNLLFGGDLLFGAGCGKLLEGTPQEMWSSLTAVLKLPEETDIFFGHEYTQKNLEFAHHIEPKNEAVTKRLEEVRKLRSEGKPTVPTTLALEKKTNPFLRADTAEMKEAVAMPDASGLEVFTHLRKLKDNW